MRDANTRQPPNKALQTDKGKLSRLLHWESRASLPLPLSLVVRRLKRLTR